MKKINCKHGLVPKEEIQARRLRVIISNGESNDELRGRIEKLHNDFKMNLRGSFYDYIKENDVVLHSAFERAGGIVQMYNYLEKYGII